MRSAAGAGAATGRLADSMGAPVEQATTKTTASADADVEMRMESHHGKREETTVGGRCRHQLVKNANRASQTRILEGYMTQITYFLLRHPGFRSYGCQYPPFRARPRAASQ